jgi:nucleotide-binding universal stress UspA family protein
MYDTVVWATDGSEEAELALQEALRLRPERLVAVHCEHPGVAPQTEAIARRVAALQDEGHEIELVVRRSEDDDPSSMVAVATELGADVIVCGASGARTTAGALVGPFTRGLLHLAPCPVLVVGARVRQKV